MITIAAVAVITDKKHRILITQRSPRATYSGLWEFPGGKIEPGETPEIALRREIKEEVDLDVLECQFLTRVDHQHEHRQLSLHVYHVLHFRGDVTCCAGQLDFKWVSFTELQTYPFPAANDSIIACLRDTIPYFSQYQEMCETAS